MGHEDEPWGNPCRCIEGGHPLRKAFRATRVHGLQSRARSTTRTENTEAAKKKKLMIIYRHPGLKLVLKGAVVMYLQIMQIVNRCLAIAKRHASLYYFINKCTYVQKMQSKNMDYFVLSVFATQWHRRVHLLSVCTSQQLLRCARGTWTRRLVSAAPSRPPTAGFRLAGCRHASYFLTVSRNRFFTAIYPAGN